MTWSFRTNGNYIDFIHTDDTSLHEETLVKSLHNTSKSVEWAFPTDITRVNFTIDNYSLEGVLITEIDFDGATMNEQADFETGIEAMFPGLAGGSPGGSSYLVLNGRISQSGTNAPTLTEINNTIGVITTGYLGVGSFRISSAGLFTVGKTNLFLISAGFTEITYQDASTINVTIYDETYTGANNWLNDNAIKIEVHP